MSISNKELVTRKKQWDKKNIEIEEEQVQKSKENASNREIYFSNKERWKTFLKTELLNDSIDETYIVEVKRIIDIVEYSSYFRNSDSLEDLEKIKQSNDLNYIKKILKQIK